MTDKNNENWKKLVVDSFCECKEPDKIVLTDDMTDETCDMCLKCNKEIKPRELDEKEEELDFSEAPLLVENDNAAYEQDRYESQTDDRVSMWGY